MTTSPVFSITDELIAELERECRTGADDHAGMDHEEESALFDRIGDVLLALMAERAELKRDAERYRWLRDRIENKGDMVIAKCSEWSIESWSGDDPDAAIDAAMQSEAKP